MQRTPWRARDWWAGLLLLALGVASGWGAFARHGAPRVQSGGSESRLFVRLWPIGSTAQTATHRIELTLSNGYFIEQTSGLTFRYAGISGYPLDADAVEWPAGSPQINNPSKVPVRLDDNDLLSLLADLSATYPGKFQEFQPLIAERRTFTAWPE